MSDEEFDALISTEKFSKYYSFAIEHIVADNTELYKITDGEWRIFKKGSDAQQLISTLQGHGTGWCTAGESTAKRQLKLGDFQVYYSLNALGEAKIPRLAIRMEGDRIAEVRGIAHQQEVDPYIIPILEEKMDEFGAEGEKYKECAEDMRRVTALVEKQDRGDVFTNEEIRFIWQIDRDISGFGNDRDPRIDEILLKRKQDWKNDFQIIFDSTDDNYITVTLISKVVQENFNYAILYSVLNHPWDFGTLNLKNLNNDTAKKMISLGFPNTVFSSCYANLDIFEGKLSAECAERFIDDSIDSIAIPRSSAAESTNFV